MAFLSLETKEMQNLNQMLLQSKFNHIIISYIHFLIDFTSNLSEVACSQNKST